MRRLSLLLATVLAAGLCLAAAVAVGATTSTETYAKLLSQIDSGSATTAVINRVAHDVKVTLKDASTEHVVYPPHDERQLVARLKAHGAQVKYTRRKKAATHHILRYIGGAIVIVIIAAGGGMFLYTRRRQGGAGS
jgi:ATP-dependent Zn protease